MDAVNQFPLWKSLLESIELIDEINFDGRASSKAEVIQILESIQLRLEGQADPVDHFELFVISRLCSAIQETLKKQK